MITEKLLLENGYKEFDVNKIVNPGANRFFQKRVRNGLGSTKFFIGIVEYLNSDYNLSYEVDLQFEKDKYVINLTMFHISEEMTLEEIEQEVHNIWFGLDFKYYDCEVD